MSLATGATLDTIKLPGIATDLSAGERSLLQTNTPYPSVHAGTQGLATEANGDTIIFVGPTATDGAEAPRPGDIEPAT
ncbi:MAG TPA: hypothetical protein VI318_10415 [Baekduia sp.]